MTKHKCEMCKIKTNLDDGFINIAEICYADETIIETFESLYDVNLQNFWCFKCTDQTIKQLEAA